ncbi:hypothetical protein [Streptomyces eurythermus]
MEARTGEERWSYPIGDAKTPNGRIHRVPGAWP